MSWRSRAEDAYEEGGIEAVRAQFEGETETERASFVVHIDYWPDESGPPLADDVFLAVQDAVGPGSRLASTSVENIEVEGQSE